MPIRTAARPRPRPLAALLLLLTLVALSTAAPRADAAVLAAGQMHTCSATTGAAQCWGNPDTGALGVGPRTALSYDPLPVSGLGAGATAVAAGSLSGCAVVGGAASCWGWNDYGQLGNGTFGGKSDVPVPVSGLGSGVTQISTSAAHVCAVQSGAAKCWGDNGGLLSGALGYSASDNQDQAAPVQVAGLTSGVTDVAAGGRHSCAIQNGAALCWGSDTNGQLGYGSCRPPSYDNTYRWTPRPVCDFPAGRKAVRIVAGADLSCAVLDDGSAWCWGFNTYGQVGNGSTENADRPQKVLASGVSDIAASQSHVCAIQGGGVTCWGWNQVGMLGNGAYGTVSTTPVAAIGMESGVTAIAVGNAHSCALKGGQTWCWGENAHAELGTDAVTSSAVPVLADGSGHGPKPQPPAPTPPAAPGPKPPVGVTPPPKPTGAKATLVKSSKTRRLDRRRRASVVTVRCPSGGAACALSVPATARVVIGRKAYTSKVSAAKRVAAGRAATVRVTLSRPAAQRLRGRTGSVSVRVRVTAPGGSVTSTVTIRLRG